jgi:hypothetical protein
MGRRNQKGARLPYHEWFHLPHSGGALGRRLSDLHELLGSTEYLRTTHHLNIRHATQSQILTVSFWLIALRSVSKISRILSESPSLTATTRTIFVE